MVKLKDLEEKGQIRSQLSELPDEFEGILFAERIQKDRMGRDAIYWDIKVNLNGIWQIVTQKFTSLHLGELARRLKELGIDDTEKLIGKKIKFEKVRFRIGNERWMPVKILE